MGIYPHEDLGKDQVPLLTDDRFHKYKSFLSLALETDMVRREGGALIKDPSKFEHVFNFNRIRVDNPVQVMANEVEPLKKLQRKIRFIAWLPAFLVKRRIADSLINRAVRRYDEAYAAFHREGESKDKGVGMPYLIGNRSRRTGIVLVHGYMAAPPEIKKLAEYLGKRGFLVYAPRVSGHGASPDDLATSGPVRTGRNLWMKGMPLLVVCVSSWWWEGFPPGRAWPLDLSARVSGVKAVFAVSPSLPTSGLLGSISPCCRRVEPVYGSHENGKSKNGVY